MTRNISTARSRLLFAQTENAKGGTGVARIPQSIIEEIKYRNPIEDVISSYVTLSRTGVNMKGLCPFHSEKTPSFTVFTGSSSFYCFGCGTGGDVISFIMKAENLDYPSALEFLAKRAGITIPESDEKDYAERGVSRSRIIEMNTAAARFFRDQLFDDAAGAPARAYLAKRQLGLPIIKRFGLGYAPNSFSALRDHLRGLGYTDEELTASFFCGVSKKNGSLYDYFRNRLMFPLIDVAGNIVAFGGRVLDDSKPKYLNTSDTPAFKKSKVLFAMNYAKNNCSDNLILCEGNIDVISLHEAGFENAVATLGTAITPDHARLMKKYTSKVIVSYDGDEAGRLAARKAVRILDEVGLETRVISITGAKDPDEYIKKYGKESFRELIEESRTKFDFIIDNVLSKYDMKNDDQKARAAHELCTAAAGMTSKVERDLFVAKVSKRIEIDKKSIEYDVSVIIRRAGAKEKKERHEELITRTSGISDRVNRDFAKAPKAAKLEEMVLGMMLCCGEFIKKSVDSKLLTTDDFVTEYGKKLFGVMMGEPDGVFDISMLNEAMTEEETSRAIRLMTDRMKLANTDEIFTETVQMLKNEVGKLRKKTTVRDDAELEEKIRKLREKRQ